MESHEAVVFHLDRAIFVIDGRKIERIAHHLSPMLPARRDVMVVEIVATADMILEGRIVVMIDSTTLVFRIDIFEHNVTQP